MGATAWLATRWLRRRWIAVVPIALIVVIGGSGAMVALSAAAQTASTYPDYLEQAEVGDVTINPALTTQEIDALIRQLPGVEQVRVSALYTVSFGEGQPIRRGSVMPSAPDAQPFVFGSYDGRYTDVDRPVVRAGRMPTGTLEIVVTPETAEHQGLAIGDVIPMSFWREGITDGLNEEALETYLNEVISPLGVEQVTVVGIVTLADEVLPDDLYNRLRAIVSPDLAERYDCIPPEPVPWLTLAETVASMIPAHCGSAQHYYSLTLGSGAAGVKPVLDAFLQQTAPMNERLRRISDLGEVPGDPPQYYLIPTETQKDLDRVERATRPTVAAMTVLGLAAALVTAVLVMLATSREMRRMKRDLVQWYQLGVSAQARAGVAALPIAGAIAMGAVLAVPVAWWFDTGPLGVVSAMAPRSDRKVSGSALLVLVAVAVITILAGLVMSSRAARRSMVVVSTVPDRKRDRRLSLRAGSPVFTEGARAAFGRRTAAPVITGVATVIAAFVAALVFGSSLNRLVSTPASFGWRWDVAAMAGAGYGDLDVDGAHELLDSDEAVAEWTYFAFFNQVALNARPMTAMVATDSRTAPGVTLLDGELPVAADQVAVGAATASELGLEIGDAVSIDMLGLSETTTIAGFVVFPTLGPFAADRVGIGEGLLLPSAMFESGRFEQARDLVYSWTSFVGADLVDGHDSSTVSRLTSAFAGLDNGGIPAVTYSEPVRPAEIIDAQDIQSVPTTVGIAFAVIAVIGLGFASWSSTRSRKRELAVLRALGLSRAQTRRTIAVHAIATMAGALVIGVPIGTVVGRALWRAFAETLGVVPNPVSPLVPLAATAVGGLLAAAVAAQLPAHLAVRTSPAEGLRSE